MDELSNILLKACREGKVEVIKFMVQNNAQLVKNKDAKRNTALHVACENGIMADGIECLYSACPEAIEAWNKEGGSPFHMACFHGKSLANIKFLHSKHPKGLETPNENGDLPIHWISENTSEEFIEYLLEQYPKSAEVMNNEGALAIHIACKKGFSMNVIRVLHKAHPAGILQPDIDGKLPIHDACEGVVVSNLELMEFFHHVSPEALQKADNKGNLALHYTVCSNPDVVKFVTQANVDALKVSNNYGYLPIHKACSLSADVEIIKILHENYPDGVRTQTSKGILPFHLAITSPSLVNHLHGLYDGAVKTPDINGRFPIHIACEQGSFVGCFKLLTIMTSFSFTFFLKALHLKSLNSSWINFQLLQEK